MIAITGASGQLGRFVIHNLLKEVEPSQLTAIVRNPEKVADLQAVGVRIRKADYSAADTWPAALAGVEKLLLISSSEVGNRAIQHANVIGAAQNAKLQLLAYTSILHADTSPLPLGQEHLETEKLLKQSGIPHVLLRNGWYTENYAASIPSALEHGSLFGAAGHGKIASAARADYASAAAKVLLSKNQAGKVYELAGDTAYTLEDFAAEITLQTGKKIQYTDLGLEGYLNLLLQVGLPAPVARLLAESDTGASQGGLFDDSRQLSRLIGRPTTPFAETIRTHLQK